jgi:hypothetical protein
MSAVTVDNPLTLPRLANWAPSAGVPRPVELIVTAHEQMERDRPRADGGGRHLDSPAVPRRPSACGRRPVLLLDQGPMVNAPKRRAGLRGTRIGASKRELHRRRADRPSRLQRCSGHHRRGRRPVDDCRCRHPPRRAAHRTVVHPWWTGAQGPAVGEPALRANTATPATSPSRATVPADQVAPRRFA